MKESNYHSFLEAVQEAKCVTRKSNNTRLCVRPVLYCINVIYLCHNNYSISLWAWNSFGLPKPLCCYPNIKMAVRNLSLNSSTATIFCFLLHLCRTSWQDTTNYKSDHIFFAFSLQTSEVLGTRWTDLPKQQTDLEQIFVYFKLRFHNE